MLTVSICARLAYSMLVLFVLSLFRVVFTYFLYENICLHIYMTIIGEYFLLALF